MQGEVEVDCLLKLALSYQERRLRWCAWYLVVYETMMQSCDRTSRSREMETEMQRRAGSINVDSPEALCSC